MKVAPSRIKYKKEQLKLTATFKGQPVEIDAAGFEALLYSLVSQMNAQFDDTREAVNLNETSFVIVRGSSGAAASSYLPTDPSGWPAAPKEYHGKFYVFSRATAADELWLCQKNAAEAYNWVQITVP
jgi:hypothetical protein